MSVWSVRVQVFRSGSNPRAPPRREPPLLPVVLCPPGAGLGSSGAQQTAPWAVASECLSGVGPPPLVWGGPSP